MKIKYTDEELIILNSSGYEHTCYKCGEKKKNTEYYPNKRVGRGRRFQSECKECSIKGGRVWSNSEKRRVSNLKKYYNLTKKEHDYLYSSQNGCCAICGREEKELNKILHVDHCHKDGKVRGLLCSNCNTSLGLMKDSIELLEKAIGYLRPHQKSFSSKLKEIIQI